MPEIADVAIRPNKVPDFPALARRSLDAVVAAGVEAYRRDRALPRLARATPAELADGSPGMRRTLLARLARALRAERNRGRAGHWTYDLNRHIALRQAYLAERASLSESAATTDKALRTGGERPR